MDWSRITPVRPPTGDRPSRDGLARARSSGVHSEWEGRRGMSTATVKRFYERVADDKALQARLNALHRKDGGSGEGQVAELVAVAAAEGYEFTAGDLTSALDAKPRRLPETELRTSVMEGDCWEGKNWFCNAQYICGIGVFHKA